MRPRAILLLAALAAALPVAACRFSGHEGRVYSAYSSWPDPEAQAIPQASGPRPEIKDPVTVADAGAKKP